MVIIQFPVMILYSCPKYILLHFLIATMVEVLGQLGPHMKLAYFLVQPKIIGEVVEKSISDTGREHPMRSGIHG